MKVDRYLVQNSTCKAVPVRKGTELRALVYHPLSLAKQITPGKHPRYVAHPKTEEKKSKEHGGFSS